MLAICTGASNEMITSGGEVEFIKKLIDESIPLSLKIARFTSLVGIYSHVEILTRYLEYKEIQYSVIETLVGRTCRWILLW